MYHSVVLRVKENDRRPGCAAEVGNVESLVLP